MRSAKLGTARKTGLAVRPRGRRLHAVRTNPGSAGSPVRLTSETLEHREVVNQGAPARSPPWVDMRTIPISGGAHEGRRRGLEAHIAPSSSR